MDKRRRESSSAARELRYDIGFLGIGTAQDEGNIYDFVADEPIPNPMA
jgi:hypothetical protein